MLTATQKRLHQQAMIILTELEILLLNMQEFKRIHDEVKADPVRAAHYQKMYDNSAAKRINKFLEYNETLKQIMEPFEKDLHQGEAPEPHLPKISAVQLAEEFYNAPPYNVIP